MDSVSGEFWLTAESENGLDDNPGLLHVCKRQNFFVGELIGELNRDKM